MDCSISGSSVHGISQAEILEWVAISFSRDLPDPEIKLAVSCIAGRFFTTEPQGSPVHQLFGNLTPLVGPTLSPFSQQSQVPTGSWGGCSGSIGPGQLSRESGTR